MTVTPTATSPTATFLLRKPRQVQGFREVISGAESITMLWIPPGRFWMGSPEQEEERYDDEGPQHLVQLQGYFMGQTPITQEQWHLVMESNPSRFNDQPDSVHRPVEQVSWHDAMEFCDRLSQRTGRHYTLPSEAQWEYACRAGTTTPFAFGGTITPELANYDGNFSYAGSPKGEYREQTTAVGGFLANAWGLQDIHGNVLEWCLDHWHDSYEGAPSDGSAWLIQSLSRDASTKKGSDDQSSAEETRLLRGGSWTYLPRYCRSAYRCLDRPDYAFNFIGFRVVCLPQDPSLNT